MATISGHAGVVDPLTQEDVAVKKAKKFGYSIAGSLSLFIHIIIFLLIGGTVIIQQIVPKQEMTGEVTESIVDTPREEMPEEVSPDMPQPTNAEPQAEAAASETSPFELNTVVIESPSPTFNVPILGTLSATPGLSSPNGAGGSGNGSAKATKKIINLFGVKAESDNLGVILDCSGSAHEFLLPAFREIDKNFASPPTVLTVGCGMTDVQDAKVELFRSIKRDKEKDKAGSRTILGQLAMAEEKYKDFSQYLGRLKRRDNVWAVNGGDINGTAIGFQQLISEGVDTIYWFSDLKDAVDPVIFEKLTSELKAKGIKVIVHNFSGDAIPERQGKMATATGGSAISKKPGSGSTP